LGKSSSNTDSFEIMKVLIATKSLRLIEAKVLVTVGYGGYKVMIKEAETISQVFNKFHHITVGTSEDNHMSNNDIPGFEDIEDNISIHEVEDEVKGSTPMQKLSNGVKDKEPPSSNGSSQHAS